MQFKLIASIISLVSLINPPLDTQVDAFWLTDSSFFPNQVEANNKPSSESSTPTKVSSKTFEAIKPSDGVTVGELLVPANKNVEPWLNVVESSTQTPTIGGVTESKCMCDLNWIQNQTNLVLNKWLASTNFAKSSTQANVSNSTAAQHQQQTRRAWDAKQHSHQRAHNASYSHWPTAATSWARTRPLAQTQMQQHAAARAVRANSSPSATKWIRADQAAAGATVSESTRVLQGPKGDNGARGEKGERGPSGLISVKDRDSLFDLDQRLAQNNTNTESKQQPSAELLVFLESDQMLVVRTEAGWRPVQLLAPLLDFRQSATDKLNQQQQQQQKRPHRLESPASVRVMSTPTTSIYESAGLGKRVKVMEASRSMVSNGNKQNSVRLEDNRVDSNEEDDDEEDEEDEEEEEELESDELDEDEELLAAAAASELVMSKQTSNQVASGEKKISGRSAAAAASLVDESIDETRPSSLESLSSKHLAAIKQTTDQLASNGADRRLKLRIAALNEPYSGNIHGIRGADFECRRNAARANIKGSFKAFLAAGFQNLNEVVRSNAHKYSVVNLRGETLANSWQDLFKQPARFLNPLSRVLSFDGRQIATDPNWPNKLVWHGANNKGGYRDLLNNCDGWHSDSLNKFGLATPIHSPKAQYGHLKQQATSKQRQRRRKRFFANQNNSTTLDQSSGEFGSVLEVIGKYPCRMPLIVLCIETAGQKQQELVREKSEFETNNII